MILVVEPLGRGEPLLTNLFEQLIGRELYGTIRHYSQAVDTISSHESCKTFFLPHSHKTAPDSLVLAIGTTRLHLSKDFHKVVVKKQDAYRRRGIAYCIIFSLSSGLTTVRDVAPATPPATK